MESRADRRTSHALHTVTTHDHASDRPGYFIGELRLKRRLSEEGMTYRGLRQSVIREYAILRLLDGSVSASEIATDLGYSDLASFSHAFKHWTGHPPTGFRRR